ncbi:MAG: glycosyltransferase family 39 protein [Synergistetes bacterium]|nr:glycosyltransferase family 39 protein [Synergistota bacterium]
MQRKLWVLVFIALILRLAFFWLAYTHNQGFFVQPDTPSYVMPALNMIKYHLFSAGIYPDIKSEIIRTPGYPLFLAMVFLLFGLKIMPILLFQIAISLLAVVFVYKIAYLIGGERAGWWAGLIAAVNPSLIISTNKILTGTLYSVMLLAAIYLIISVLVCSKRGLSRLAFGFLILSLAAFVRPIGMYMGIVLVIVFLFWMFRNGFGLLKSLFYSLILLLIFVLPIVGWSYRNYVLTGYRGFSAIQSWDLLNYGAASTLALKNDSRREVEAKKLMENVLKEFKGKQWGELYNIMQKHAVEVILKNKWHFAIVQFKGILAVWSSTRAGDFFVASGILDEYPNFGKFFYHMSIKRFILFMWKNYRGILLLHFVLVVFYIFEYLLMLLGLFSTKWKLPVIVVLVVILYLSILSGGSLGTARFKVPIEPMVAILAGLGASRWIYRRNKKVVDNV